MRRFNITLRMFLLLCVLLGVTRSTSAQELHYTLRFAPSNTHLLDITIDAHRLPGPNAVFSMPYWAPGVYIGEEFAQNVQDVFATDLQGKPLSLQKLDGQTWQIALQGSNDVRIQYKVYANGLFFRGAQYNDRQASLTGAAVWMYLVGGKDLPITLTIDRHGIPASWKIATGLTPLATGKEYREKDYDSFADCPIEISDFREQSFRSEGTAYHVVVNNELGDTDFSVFTEKLHRVIEKGVVPILAKAVDGPTPAPFSEYWFLIHVTPGITGAGVEHHNSTTITLGSNWNDRSETSHDEFQTLDEYKVALAAHEFFHAWNVKRLRPVELGPFDYTQPVHTQSLWIAEGLTDYYTDVALLRSGLWTRQIYLDRLARVMTVFATYPGRSERSIADTSWDTWFGFRGSGAGGLSNSFASNLENTSYSYYEGGHVLGILLDLEIRNATANHRSLDDWMQEMYRRFALPKRGYTPNDAIQVASEVAGRDMQPFFTKYVTGREPLPYAQDLAYAGIELKSHTSSIPWTGLELEDRDTSEAIVVNLVPNSPAERAGLDRGDRLEAIEGQPVKATTLQRLLKKYPSGSTIHIKGLRRGISMEFALVLADDPYPIYSLIHASHTTPLQDTIWTSVFSQFQGYSPQQP